MKHKMFRVAAVLLFTLGSCADETAQPPLDSAERALVETYVRLTVLQALHERKPDSTLVELQHLESEVDSVAIQNALERLAADPMRWELVYAAIASRLEELDGTPALWWSVAHGDSLPTAPGDSSTAPVRVPIPSERAPGH